MKKIQQDKVEVISLTTTVLTEAPQEVKDEMPGIEAKTTTLAAKLVLIRDNMSVQGSYRKGTAIVKQTRRALMETRTNYLSAKGSSFAGDTDNAILLDQVEIAPSTLSGMTDQLSAAKSKDIHDKLVPFVLDMVDYGVTALTFSDQLHSVDSFLSFINMPRATYEERVQATTNIGVLINECDELLVGTDRSVRGIRTTQPVFYSKYFHDRKIHRTGGRILALRGNITKVDGTPLKGAKILIKGSGITKKSTAKGNFQVRHLDPGVWEILCTLEGYRDYKTTIAVTANQRTEMVVVMESVLMVV